MKTIWFYCSIVCEMDEFLDDIQMTVDATQVED